MSTLKQLIQNQDISFDTHQAGDSQRVNWKAVHLEKSMHGERGKARFPLLDDTKESKSESMNDGVFRHIKSEVRRTLKKNPKLVEDLAKVIAEQLQRFGGHEATEADAKMAAKKLAGYFGLREDFEEIVIREFKGRLASVTTYHHKTENGEIYQIEQSANAIRLRSERTNIYRAVIH